MASTLSLTDARAAVRNRHEMESVFIPDPELDSYLNAGVSAIYEEVTSRDVKWALAQSADYSWPAGTESVDLNDICGGEVHTILGVDAKNGSRWATLERGAFGERNRAEMDWGGTVRVWWIPPAPQFDEGVVDTIATYNLWDEFIILYASFLCLNKEESSTRNVELLMEATRRRILKGISGGRDKGNPAKTRDKRRERRSRTWHREYSVVGVEYLVGGSKLWLRRTAGYPG